VSTARSGSRVAAGVMAICLVSFVDSSPANDGEKPVARTPKGVECPKGIIELEARSNTEFVVEGESATRRQLAKALRKARRTTPFDCVLIDGGRPSGEEVMMLVVELSRMNIHHVEWSGTQPATPKP